MENQRDTFHYTYSAKQQEEIQNIRKKYLPPEQGEDKMAQLRRLDQSATKKRHSALHHPWYRRLPVSGIRDVL